MSSPKLNFKEETSAKKTRSPPKKARVEQSTPKKKKLKLDADKAAEKAQHLRFGKAELTPDELSRLSKAQKREMYAAHAAQSAAHREIDQYEEDNVGVQALNEGEKAAETIHDVAKSRYARKLKKKAKMQGKKGSKTAKSSAQEPNAPQNAGDSGTSEGGSNWLSRWKQRQEIHKSYYAAARSGGTAAQTAGGKKAASSGASAARSGVEQVVDKGKSVVSTAVNGLMTAAKSNAHVLVIVGVFVLLILMVMSGFSSCGILFSGGTQVSGQTIYTAEDRDIRGAEQDYKKLENRGLEVVIREELDDDQWKRYEIFQNTLGGRPYLFNGGLPPGGSDGSGAPGIDYTVPAEALTDSEFAAIYEEAKKYVGTPYVWGGSSPETGFDCSGYVCWVYNQNGYDVGRTTANGLWNKCQHISEAEAKPGDLVFFKGTYDTPGMSHTGIYLGNGMMVSAGDPIKYANIHSSYWEKHLAGFGRLSK